MKKINHLLKNEDFKNVIDHRKKIYNTSFSISYIFTDLNRSRVGISVSKKLGNAVTRNKIKRQIRMIASSIIPITLNVDMIIVPGKDFMSSTYQNNYDSFLNLFKKLDYKGDLRNEKQN